MSRFLYLKSIWFFLFSLSLSCSDEHLPIHITTYENGQIESEEYAIESLGHSRIVYYFDSLGILVKTYEKVNGVPDGREVGLYSNGDTMYQGYLRQGQRTGNYTWYYQNSIKEQELVYLNDKPFRGCLDYDSTGKPMAYRYFFGPDTLVYKCRFDNNGHIVEEKGLKVISFGPNEVNVSDTAYFSFYVVNPTGELINGEMIILDERNEVMYSEQIKNFIRDGPDLYKNSYIFNRPGKYFCHLSIDPHGVSNNAVLASVLEIQVIEWGVFSKVCQISLVG